MNYLIDTHILLWHSEGEKLSERVVSIISDSSNSIYISHATFWEMTIKKSLGKLDLITSISDFYQLVLDPKF